MLLDLPNPGSDPGAANWAGAWGRVRFSPDGSRLYASGFGPTAVFDTRTGALVGQLGGEGILAISPDGDSALIRDGSTAARIVDLNEPTRFRLLESPSVIHDGAFSPDGRYVVTTGRDDGRVWSASSGAFRESLHGHVGEVKSAAFLPTGELVTAGADGALITWALGDWTASFRDSRREGGESIMPRDDRTLVYDRPDGSFVGISADPDIWLERACAVAGRGLSQQDWRTVFGDRPTTLPARAGSFAAPQ